MAEVSNKPLPMHKTLISPAQRALKRLGLNISKARRRHHLSRNDLAAQMGVSESSVARLEKGEPGVALQTLISALLVLHLLDDFMALLEPAQDTVGLLIQEELLPQRVRKSH